MSKMLSELIIQKGIAYYTLDFPTIIAQFVKKVNLFYVLAD